MVYIKKEQKSLKNLNSYFARLDPKEVEKKVEALYPQKEEKQEDDNQITIDDFAKIELVVGTVEKCEKHPDADKLLVSQINIGKETRQIVSGIARFLYTRRYDW